jgi:hypothetical protein
MSADCKPCSERKTIERIRNEVDGNGRPSLRTEIEVLKTRSSQQLTIQVAILIVCLSSLVGMLMK